MTQSIRRALDPATGQPFPPEPVRSLFATKTALAQYLLLTAGSLAAFWPEAVPWVSSHAGLILIGASAVNLLIRKITHGKVSLFGGE